jgi:hypothetical protein
MQSPDLLDPRAVLGTVKARPGSAQRGVRSAVTAGLDRACARRDRRYAGRDEGTALSTNKGTAQDKERSMT